MERVPKPAERGDTGLLSELLPSGRASFLLIPQQSTGGFDELADYGKRNR
jgi:hypothetical protein